MAQLLVDGVTVGLPYTTDTAIRIAEAGDLSAALLIPRGVYELKPPIPPLNSLIQQVRDLTGILPEKPPVYISPYDSFTQYITVVPSVPNEKISNVSILGPFACFLEDPLPEITNPLKTLRSFETALRIGVSPWWAPGLFFEPYVSAFDSSSLIDAGTGLPIVSPEGLSYPIPPSPVTVSPSGDGPGWTFYNTKISGYYTERNWTDREWILKHRDVYARYNINGRFTMPGNKVKMPLYRENIKDLRASAITPYTFFSQSVFTAGCIEEVMLPYLRCAEQIIQWKPSEIKMMRFYFIIFVDSVIYLPYTPPFQSPPPSIIVKTPIVCHMTVDSQNDLLGILKLLCANALVGHGNCDPQVYDDLNNVPDRSQGGDDLESECFRIDDDFDAGIENLNAKFSSEIGKFIGDDNYTYDPNTIPNKETES